MAWTNALVFQLGIGSFVERVAERRRQITKAVALRALKGIVLNTRVDTGRMRGNWQVGEGTPPSGEIDRLDPSGLETIREGNTEILAMSGDEVIWLHNGVPYVTRWEAEDKMVAGEVEALKTWLGSQR